MEGLETMETTMNDLGNYQTSNYLERQDLPKIYSNGKNGDANRPLSWMEKMIIEKSKQIDEDGLTIVCETLLFIMDSSEELPLTLQLMHGVWQMGNRVLYHKQNKITPDYRIEMNLKVTQKALSNRSKMLKIMHQWII